MAPDLRAISRPRCTSISVGMLWIEKRCSSSGAASLSTLISRTSGSSSVAACSKIGAIALQGTAPGCPEINEQRNVTVLCMLVEPGGAIQCSRPPFVERPVAGPALAALAEPFPRHTVDRVAMRTDNVQRAGHGCSRKHRCCRVMRRVRGRLDRHQFLQTPGPTVLSRISKIDGRHSRFAPCGRNLSLTRQPKPKRQILSGIRDIDAKRRR